MGIPTANQSILGDETLVGHCVNFLPLRAQFDSNCTFAELLKLTRGTLMSAYEHQNYTYGTLLTKLKLRRVPGRLPLTEVQFNVERSSDAAGFEGVAASVDTNPKASVNFDLFFNVAETKSGLVIDCDYNSAYFEAATIDRFLAQYEQLMIDAIANPQEKLSDLSIATSASSSIEPMKSEPELASPVRSIALNVAEKDHLSLAGTANGSSGGAFSYDQLERWARRWVSALWHRSAQ